MIMTLFSERYNITKPSDVLLRECFPKEVANGVCTCFDKLERILDRDSYSSFKYSDLEQYLWIYFLNKRQNDFWSYGREQIVATTYMLDDNIDWYKKLDMLKTAIKYLYIKVASNKLNLAIANDFVFGINFFFSKLHYSYKVVNKEIIEITSETEVKAIEDALEHAKDNVKEHLASALELYATRPNGDYRNSIKESISAVEAYCREQTGENTLGKALKKMEEAGFVFPKILKDSFEKLYAYTNQPDTGIRHALMDDEGKYVPGQEEALFMLVSCSSFLNYLKKKE